MTPACKSLVIENADAGRLRLAWLAGLLEAEGTFIRPVPSEPRLPIIACQMTDLDVIERVAAMFGTTVTPSHRRNRRAIYATRIKGSRAVMLMSDLAPMMGDRRRCAISKAVRAYEPPQRKLNQYAANRIRTLHAHGASVSHLARTFGVARSTIRQVVRGSIYVGHDQFLWRKPGPLALPRSTPAMSAGELHWLSGWLEGEGAFLRPPPSDPRRARIVARTRDADVASKVGSLMGVAPLFSHDLRERQRGWSPTWRLLVRGRNAVQLMKAVHPFMGTRRQSQIELALAGVGWS